MTDSFHRSLDAALATSRMTDTVMCDGCGEDLPWIDWCDHGRVTCSECVDFAPCRFCKREARP